MAVSHSGGFSAADCLLLQIVSAVHYCHQKNIVHRDLKVSPSHRDQAPQPCQPCLVQPGCHPVPRVLSQAFVRWEDWDQVSWAGFRMAGEIRYLYSALWP